MKLLRLQNISVHYGPFKALHNIEMNAKEGELVVLLGANGAGKSIIFRTISGLTKPSEGTITFVDKKIDGLSPDRLVKHGIVQCPEGRKLFPQMTVSENLLMGGYIHTRGIENEKEANFSIHSRTYDVDRLQWDKSDSR